MLCAVRRVLSNLREDLVFSPSRKWIPTIGGEKLIHSAVEEVIATRWTSLWMVMDNLSFKWESPGGEVIMILPSPDTVPTSFPPNDYLAHSVEHLHMGCPRGVIVRHYALEDLVTRDIHVCPRCLKRTFTAREPHDPSWMDWALDNHWNGRPLWEGLTRP
jgi:hypothetical protein